jgi:hypothetical protein
MQHMAENGTTGGSMPILGAFRVFSSLLPLPYNRRLHGHHLGAFKGVGVPRSLGGTPGANRGGNFRWRLKK